MTASSDTRGSAAARARRDAGALRRIGTALLARQREIGRAITARVVDELPEYREASERVHADLLAGATEVAGLLAGSLAGGRGLRREDAAGVRALAARRVHQGVELEVFLHAYRVALFAFWDACAEEAERLRLPRSAGYALGREAIEAIDVVTTQAAEGFLREEARVRTRSGREARDLVERLVGGRPPDVRHRHPGAPGLDPTGTLVVVVGRAEPGDQSPGDALLVARDVVAEGLRPPLIALRHDELVAITRTVRDADLLAVRAVALARAIDLRFGLGFPSAGFAGVERAYREAVLCLASATLTRPVVLLRDLPALETAMVGADATARAVIAAKGTGLRALDPTDRAMAVDTIRAFAGADLNVARAATALQVHQNTVRHRLDRINATTGHDPRTFRGLVDLLCAVETLHDGPSQAP
jgi:PucR C-terminal helix-turn-helix domain/GGDEF-like domain